MEVVFKPYDQNQIMLFPPALDELIPENHPARLISWVVDRLDISPIMKTYKGGGTSSYHPRMMLKVLFFAYLLNVFSSRKIEKLLCENVAFMWLSGMQCPDFRTINNFRSKRLKKHIQKLFSEVVIMLAELGMVDIRKIAYTDGTKIEANANKYTFVWQGSVNYQKDKLEARLKSILKEISAQIKLESKEKNQEGFDIEKLDSALLEEKIEELNQKIKDDDRIQPTQKKKLQRKIEKIEKNELKKLKQYEKQLEIMGPDRKSYSKTDPDATFMRMKDDRMNNKELKPAYNVQISTQNQIITHYGIYQNRTDTRTYIDHLKKYHEHYGVYPEKAVADAGYGSEENYAFMEAHSIVSYVKYNWYEKEQKKKHRLDISNVSNLYYNEKEDYFVCPIGQKMYLKRRYKEKNRSGYEQEISVYQAQNCRGCPMRGSCHKSAGNRQIRINHRLRKYKEISRQNLLSEEGEKYRKKRSVEPESVFGQLKQNKGFRRFSLRGLENVETEFGLVAISHNLQKLWKWLLGDNAGGRVIQIA